MRIKKEERPLKKKRIEWADEVIDVLSRKKEIKSKPVINKNS